MHTTEPGVLTNSDYYIHTASAQALNTFFYPVCVGYFRYAPGYYLNRGSYDSFLLMIVKKGEFHVCGEDGTRHTAKEGQIVILDCYAPHSYSSSHGGALLWMHFDGPVARQYYELITAAGNPVITLKDCFKLEKNLSRIYESFSNGSTTRDALLSQYITIMLTELLVGQESSSVHSQQSDAIEDTVAYINEHLTENLSLKFLLKNSNTSIKEICFCTGFSNESSFCTTFKKWVKQTPTDYRVNA